MTVLIILTDESAFERVREAIRNREDPDETDTPTGPDTPTSG